MLNKLELIENVINVCMYIHTYIKYTLLCAIVRYLETYFQPISI